MKGLIWGDIFKKAIALTEYSINDVETPMMYKAVVSHIDTSILNHIINNKYDENWNKNFLSAIENEIAERILLNKLN